MDNQIEKIQDYIDGQLTGNELLEFEAQLVVDNDLRNLLALQKEVYIILNKRVVHKEIELRATISASSNNFRYDKNAKVINLKMITSMVAVVCFLIIGSFFFFNKTNDLYDLPLMNLGIVKGQEENISHEKAVKAFNNKDYKGARTHLESLLLIVPHQIQYEYFLGLTYAGEDRWVLASEKLASIAKGESIFADLAKYYLAVSYFKSGENVKAKVLLKELGDKNELGMRAQKLLETIK